MANTIKIKRGTNLSNAGTPEAGELIYKSDSNELFVGDGSTAATSLTAIGGSGSGDIEGVTAGTGLSGGGSSGTVSLAVDLSELTDMTASVNSSQDELIILDNGADRRKLISEIPLSAFNNDSGFITATLTTEAVQDIVGAMFTSNTETRGSLTYDDSDGTIDLVVDDMTANDNTFRTVTAGGNTLGASETLAFTAGSNITISESGGAVTIASTDTNTQLSTEQVQDIVGAMFDSNTETRISATYQDGDGTIDLVVDDMTANDNTVTTNIAGTGVSVSSGTGNSTISTNDSEIVHDNLSGFVANEHIDHTTVSILGGAGLTGGGTIAASRNIHIGAGTGITVNTDDVAINFKDEDDMSSNSASHAATQQSIKAYVDAEVAGIVNSAPSALNTLDELAAALGDDANFATTTSTSLGNRLRVDTASQGLTSTQQANAITNLGITATKAELNYVDGVTSNIQTQLDAKIEATLTTEQVQDIAGGMFSSNTETGIAVSYVDGDGTIDLTVDYLPATDDRDVKPNAITTSGVKQVRAYFTTLEGLTGSSGSDYQDLLVLDTYSDGSGGDANALAFDKSEQKIRHYLADQSDSTWGTAKVLAYEDTFSGGTNLTLSGTTFNVDDAFLKNDADDTTSGTVTGAGFNATNYFQINKSGSTGSLLKLVNSGWSNATTHDIIYNSYLSNLGDFTYLKSAGNSTTGHGIAMVADSVFAVGDTSNETGNPDNDAADPFTDTWFTVDGSGNGVFKGSVTATSLDISGDIDVDGTTNLDALDVDGAANLTGRVTITDGGADGLLINNDTGNSADSARIFFEGTSTSVIMQQGSDLSFRSGATTGSSSGTERVSINATGMRIHSGSLGVAVAGSSTDGRIDASNDVVAFSTSDKRLKENIKPLDSALDKVLQINGVSFDWKKLTEKEKKTIHGNQGHDVGVIAQEIEEVLPEVVQTRDNGYKAVKYEKIVPLLIESIKELKAEIEELKK